MQRIAILSGVLAWLVVSSSAHGADDILIADFEGKDYGGWKVAGGAFGPGPARGTLAQQQKVTGFRGKGLVNTFLKGDLSTGTLTSPLLKIQRRYINFLIGGGRHPGRVCINLLVGNKIVCTATGGNDGRLLWASWDVAKLRGKTVRIQVVDNVTTGWGHINIDHIVQSDKPRAKGGAIALSGQPLGTDGLDLAALKKLGAAEIIFAVRKVDSDGHWYANFSYWSNNEGRKLYHDGGRLCRLNVATGKVTNLLDDPTGGVRDLQLHYDGKNILFSYRKGGQPFYNLYEINIDPGAPGGLKQITNGPYDDIEATYLADGGIIFCSSRCNRMVQCWFVRVAVIYRCDGDGKNIRQLSSNIEQDNTPWPLPDGRILHQRWEYIDRSQVSFHHLWTMNPDGTGQMVYYGNQHPSVVMLDAKPIPGTTKVVALFSPGHGRREHAGVVTIVDPRAGPDAKPFARAISKGAVYRDPYPLSEELFLVARETEILLMGADGRTRSIYALPAADKAAGLKLHEPRPVRTRPRERVIPPRTNPALPTGRVVLADVYKGRNMAGAKRGQIKKLLVLEALPKPVNFSGSQEPISIGGTFTLERILGTVPVESDGSAHIELPAMRSLFFVALDENDMSVKRMQSFLTVQPGEVLSCVGCHEQRTETALPSGNLAAIRRGPSKIRPIADVPDVIDFPRDIQPILDKHCVACHGYEKTAKGGPRSAGVILTGDRGPWYSHSYYMLTIRGQFSDGRNRYGNRPPRDIGSSASPIMKKIMGPKTHHDVKLSPHQKKMIRLWIDSAAAYPGTYAALGSGMIGRGHHGVTQKVYAARCRKCHRQPPAADIAYNLTRPPKSLVLLKPLARSAGGIGMMRTVKKGEKNVKEHVAVFKSTADPDYQALLKSILAAKKRLDAIKRFDMPGFRPNEHYIREMKVYGILPKDFGPKDPIDAYKTDRAYWRSLWQRPAGTK